MIICSCNETAEKKIRNAISLEEAISVAANEWKKLHIQYDPQKTKMTPELQRKYEIIEVAVLEKYTNNPNSNLLVQYYGKNDYKSEIAFRILTSMPARNKVFFEEYSKSASEDRKKKYLRLLVMYGKADKQLYDFFLPLLRSKNADLRSNALSALDKKEFRGKKVLENELKRMVGTEKDESALSFLISALMTIFQKDSLPYIYIIKNNLKNGRYGYCRELERYFEQNFEIDFKVKTGS